MATDTGNGAGVMKAPSIAKVSAVEAHQGGERPPVEAPAPDAAAVRREAFRAALAMNTWGAKAPDGRTVAEHLAERVEARRDGRERPIPTPWKSLNAALGGGVWPGFHVIVGATGAGKSQLALQLALHAATNKESPIPALYIALELDDFGLMCRAGALLSRGRVFAEGKPASPSWSDLYTGKAPLPAFVAAELAAIPLHWCEADAHGFPYDSIAPAVEALRALYPKHAGPVVVVLDFLQLVSSPEGVREELRERIGKAAYRCRMVAREHRAAVIALSSTARAMKTTGRSNDPLFVRPNDDGKVTLPELRDLVGMGKESGDVEYSADSVMVLCRESWAKGKPPPKDGQRVHVGVAKLRAGKESWAHLAFNGTRFKDAPSPAEESPAAANDGPDASTGDTSSAASVALPSRGRARKGKSSAPPPQRDPREPAEPDDDDDGEGDS